MGPGSLGPGPLGTGPVGGPKTFPRNEFFLRIIAYVNKNSSITKKTNPFKSVLKVDKIKKHVFYLTHPFQNMSNTVGKINFLIGNVKLLTKS